MSNMKDTVFQHTTTAGTAAGTALTIIGVGSEDIIKTVCLAAIGAVVSFFVSLGLKLIVKAIKGGK